MPESLKQKTVKGVSWSFAEQLLPRGANFVIGIIIARILSPEDYGLVGMLGIFLGISQLFIDGGLTSALIRTKNPSEKDYSTVYLINIGLSILFYFILFFSAPLIAAFYNQPLLKSMTRVVALILVISSVASVQGTRLTIKVDFKTRTTISALSSLISGLAGLVCAYWGWGVWALVAQSLTSAASFSFLTLLYVRWIPKFLFSVESFRRLFSFSSKLLLSSCIHSIYQNCYPLVIGKRFSPASVGLYSRAGQFPDIADSVITGALNRVAFPVLSQCQDDNERLLHIYEKYIQLSSFLVFPLMMGLCGCARPLVLILLKEKWLACVPLMQMLCFSRMLNGIITINLNLLYVKGRSDFVLRLEIIKKTIAFLILFITMFFDLKVICLGQVFYGFIALYLNTHYTKTILGYTFCHQMKAVVPYFLLSLSVLLISVSLTSLIPNAYMAIAACLVLCPAVYLALAHAMHLYAYQEVKDLVQNRLHTQA